MKQLSKVAACALAAVLLTTGCSTFFKRNPAADGGHKAKHYIMTIHGVRGDENSFADFPELVKIHLEKVDPGYEVIPLKLAYKTAQTDYTPHKAAAEINAKLDQMIPVLNPEDKISVVAYSMGGQVGVAWYFDSLNDPKHAQYPAHVVNFVSLAAAYWGAEEAGFFTNDLGLIKNDIKSVILELNKISQELARQYIGDITATGLAKAQTYINDKILFPQLDSIRTMDQMRDFYDNKTIKSLYGKWDFAGSQLDKNETLRTLRNSSLRNVVRISFEELQALAMAGTTVTELRTQMMLAPKEKTAQTKWTSLATIIPCFKTDKDADVAGCNNFQNASFEEINKLLVKFDFGWIRRETDNAVINPSSIAQFHYAVDGRTSYADGELLPASAFQWSVSPENHKAIFAETLHATIVTQGLYDRATLALGRLGKSWANLADDVVLIYKEKCLQPETCDHPAYKYILQALADCDKDGNTCDKNAYENVIGKFQNRTGHDQPIETVQNILKSELHGFTLELNLRLPPHFDVSKINDSNIFDYIKVNFAENSNSDRIVSSDTAPYKIHLARKQEFASVLIKKVDGVSQSYLKVNFTGLITTDRPADYDYVHLENGLPLKFSVALPGLKTRQVEAVVSPYHSTFVDLTMAR